MAKSSLKPTLKPSFTRIPPGPGINGTDPKWQGYFDFISLLSLTVLLGWLLAGAARAER